MIINCHAHIYPDKIAKTIEEGISKRFGPLYSSFKVSSLLEDMEKFDVGITIGFCIAERPRAVEAMTVMAMGGWAYLCGEFGGRPVVTGFPQSFLCAAGDAAIGTIIACMNANSLGRAKKNG